jgi:hypothetical protein
MKWFLIAGISLALVAGALGWSGYHAAAIRTAGFVGTDRSRAAASTGAPSAGVPSSGGKGTALAASPGARTSQAPSAATTAPTPVPPPSREVSLAGWKLTLPVGPAGTLSGNKAVELSPATLDAPWLTRDADGALSFWAPAVGATTAHSSHSRTELVSTTGFVLGKGPDRTLTATVSVSQTPDQNHTIIVGQLHGGGSISSEAFAMLHYRAGQIYVFTVDATPRDIVLMNGIPLGARFSYTIEADNAAQTVIYSVSYHGRTATATVRDPAAFLGTEQRFQAGDYQQATKSGSVADGGRVTFYALSVRI